MANPTVAVKRPNISPRQDPAPRRTDATSVWDKTSGRDPNRHYVLAYKGDVETGMHHYLGLGYVVETWRDDGPRFRGGRTGRDGDEMEMRGHVLMSIPIDARRQLEEVGPDGVTGQRHIDELEKLIVKRRNTIDVLRGIGGLRGRSGDLAISVSNRTSELEPDGLLDE